MAVKQGDRLEDGTIGDDKKLPIVCSAVLRRHPSSSFMIPVPQSPISSREPLQTNFALMDVLVMNNHVLALSRRSLLNT